ncbi:Uncharacterized protein APZ42_033566 [Daphnia magna]|uniref:Uncharacterized protein n=1 Tax=Daphnia magna TaxID=35525 RepID=A0A164KZ93_9CRUS|nr:Uncharacterized protein APZ42_033566 [Daphnia magna]
MQQDINLFFLPEVNRRWPSCPRDPSRRLHPLPPSTRPVPEQQLEEKTVEPDNTEDVVGSEQRVIQAEKRLESTAKDLEESYVEKSIEAAKEGSEKSKDVELESTAKDLKESNVDKSIEAAQDSSEKSEGAELEITTNDLEESDVEGSLGKREHGNPVRFRYSPMTPTVS